MSVNLLLKVFWYAKGTYNRYQGPFKPWFEDCLSQRIVKPVGYESELGWRVYSRYKIKTRARGLSKHFKEEKE